MLLGHIERHLRRTKMSPTRFGRDAVGDPNFVLDLRDGREPRRGTALKVIAFIDAYQDELAAREPGR